MTVQILVKHPGPMTGHEKPMACRYFQVITVSYNCVVVSNIFYFHPYLGKIPILSNIFQMGWNHQLDKLRGTTHYLPNLPSYWMYMFGDLGCMIICKDMETPPCQPQTPGASSQLHALRIRKCWRSPSSEGMAQGDRPSMDNLRKRRWTVFQGRHTMLLEMGLDMIFYDF